MEPTIGETGSIKVFRSLASDVPELFRRRESHFDQLVRSERILTDEVSESIDKVVSAHNVSRSTTRNFLIRMAYAESRGFASLKCLSAT